MEVQFRRAEFHEIARGKYAPSLRNVNGVISKTLYSTKKKPTNYMKKGVLKGANRRNKKNWVETFPSFVKPRLEKVKGGGQYFFTRQLVLVI